jgi:hypothetical protein
VCNKTPQLQSTRIISRWGKTSSPTGTGATAVLISTNTYVLCSVSLGCVRLLVLASLCMRFLWLALHFSARLVDPMAELGCNKIRH